MACGSRSTPARRLGPPFLRAVLVALSSGLLLACKSEERPAPSGNTIVEGGVVSIVDAGVTTPVEAGSDPVCEACTSTTCSAQFTACTKDPACSTCFDTFSVACFSSASFQSALACTCGAGTCRSACVPACVQIEALACVVDKCASEYAACTRDSACNTCLGGGPAAGCDRLSVAVTLAQCACDRCKPAGACGGP